MSSATRLQFLALSFVGVVAIASPAHAQGRPPASVKPREPVTAAACKPEPGKPYFVEFRSRTAASYGHSFLFHGKLGAPGKFGKFDVAGLHPRGDDPAVYMQGHVMPVPAETGASFGDLDEQYMTARFCVVLTESEYQRAAAFIRRQQATKKEWHAPTNNCNGFIGEIAEYMGLKTPPSAFLYPEAYVSMLGDLNRKSSSPIAASFSLPIPYEQWGLQRPKR
jgi:hypothetical protein